ncbi:MAG: PaaI family thioesterase [Caulobacteraceae bacterium]|nr:PaaI family thioesterase [Caulobacteraceae bacterium]
MADDGFATAEILPFARLMGIETLEAAQQRVRLRLMVREDLCTTGGILHGGAIMALADTAGALGAALNLPEGARTTTLESKTNFVGSARAGTPVTAEATPLHLGRRTSVWQTRIEGEGGRLVAVVTQTQLTLEARP